MRNANVRAVEQELQSLQRENAELKATLAQQDKDWEKHWQAQRQAIRMRTNLTRKEYGKASQRIHDLRNEVKVLRTQAGINDYADTHEQLLAEIRRVAQQRDDMKSQRDHWHQRYDKAAQQIPVSSSNPYAVG